MNRFIKSVYENIGFADISVVARPGLDPGNHDFQSWKRIFEFEPRLLLFDQRVRLPARCPTRRTWLLVHPWAPARGFALCARRQLMSRYLNA
jgi:hypothetical protein